MTEVDVLIIGGGVAGLAAAMYSGRFNLKTLVVGKEPGGATMLTDDIQNYPGFEKIGGMELVDKLTAHAKTSGAEVTMGSIEKIEKNDKMFATTNTKSEVVNAKTIIFATGTDYRKLGVPGEKEYLARGVHFCALCDAPLYKGKNVAMVGGGDGAVKESVAVAQHADKVTVIHLHDDVRGEPINVKKMKETTNISTISNNTIVEIKGDGKKLTSVVLQNPVGGKTELEFDGLFVEIGRIPLSSLAKDAGVELDEHNQVIVDKVGKTNIEGFYGAGDVTNSTFKQAITGVAQGVSASHSAFEYINKNF
ncbi:FAD-dependent oxidoreductase [Candidatus Woesearchaeota archaeon]|nr:FAD-dependent oxidoreductase [Candidatus Woesearchaeota archaeon]